MRTALWLWGLQNNEIHSTSAHVRATNSRTTSWREGGREGPAGEIREGFMEVACELVPVLPVSSRVGGSSRSQQCEPQTWAYQQALGGLSRGEMGNRSRRVGGQPLVGGADTVWSKGSERKFQEDSWFSACASGSSPRLPWGSSGQISLITIFCWAMKLCTFQGSFLFKPRRLPKRLHNACGALLELGRNTVWPCSHWAHQPASSHKPGARPKDREFFSGENRSVRNSNSSQAFWLPSTPTSVDALVIYPKCLGTDLTVATTF